MEETTTLQTTTEKSVDEQKIELLQRLVDIEKKNSSTLFERVIMCVGIIVGIILMISVIVLVMINIIGYFNVGQILLSEAVDTVVGLIR